MANKNEIAKELHKVISEALEKHGKEQADILAKKEEELRKGLFDSAKAAVGNVWAGIKESLASDHAQFGHVLPQSQEVTAPSQRSIREATQKVVGGSTEVTNKVSPSQAIAGQKAPITSGEVTAKLSDQQILGNQFQRQHAPAASKEATIEQTIKDAPSPSITSGTDAPSHRRDGSGRVILPSTHAAIVDRAFAHPVSDIADAAALSSAGAQKRSLGVPVVSEQRGAHGIQPTAKAEMLIDLKNANDSEKRIKVINDKGTVAPGDKAIKEPVKSQGNGGKPLAKADDPFKQRAPPIAHKHCPRCGSTRAHPVGSVNQGGQVKESWICDNCNHQWITNMSKSAYEIDDLLKSDIENDFAGLNKGAKEKIDALRSDKKWLEETVAKLKDVERKSRKPPEKRNIEITESDLAEFKKEEKTTEVSNSQVVGSSTTSGKKRHRVGASDSHTSEKTVDENTVYEKTKKLKDSTILSQQRTKDAAENKKNYSFVNKLRGIMGNKKPLNVRKAEATAPYAGAPMLEHNAQKAVAPAPKSSMVKAEPPVAKPPPSKDSHGSSITHTAGKSSTPGKSSKNTMLDGGPNTAAANSAKMGGALKNSNQALPALPVLKAEPDASKPPAKPSVDERLANTKTKLAEADKISAATQARPPAFKKAEELCKEKEGCGEMEKAVMPSGGGAEFSPSHFSKPSSVTSAVPKVQPQNFSGSDLAHRSTQPVADSPAVTAKPKPALFEQHAGPSGLDIAGPRGRDGKELAAAPRGSHVLFSQVFAGKGRR